MVRLKPLARGDGTAADRVARVELTCTDFSPDGVEQLDYDAVGLVELGPGWCGFMVSLKMTHGVQTEIQLHSTRPWAPTPIASSTLGQPEAVAGMAKPLVRGESA